MYRDKTVAVIIPAYNEEKLVGKVLQTIPLLIDHIVVVDDASRDRTGEVIKDYSMVFRTFRVARHHEFEIQEMKVLRIMFIYF
jgi:glycosyltransferase involved in cell wall biosynthesis